MYTPPPFACASLAFERLRAKVLQAKATFVPLAFARLRAKVIFIRIKTLAAHRQERSLSF
jgi:hypothetical protein